MRPSTCNTLKKHFIKNRKKPSSEQQFFGWSHYGPLNDKEENTKKLMKFIIIINNVKSQIHNVKSQKHNRKHKPLRQNRNCKNMPLWFPFPVVFFDLFLCFPISRCDLQSKLES